MRSLRPSSRRVPDWQTGCIDNKWRWIAPWGVFAVVGAAVALLCCTPSICASIERNTLFEFKLKLADPSMAYMPGMIVIRIHSESEIQVGGVTLDVSPPKIQTDDMWLRRELEWKQALIRKKNIRTAIRRELKTIPATPGIMVCVRSQTPLDTIAIVWTTIQAISKAPLYLEVGGAEQRGIP